MDIVSYRHKGLKRYLEKGDGRGIRADFLPKVSKQISALIAAPEIEQFEAMPGWHVHVMTGDRAGVWSLTVSGNYRLTFEIEDGDIINLDLEDYH